MNARAKVEGPTEEVELDKIEQAGRESPVQAEPAAAPALAQVAPKRKRRGLRFLLMAVLPAVLIVGGGYVWITGGRYQDTQNANLRQARVSIASEVAGRVVTANVAENGTVAKGDVLFIVDPQPYQIALEQADAALAAARIQVEQLRAGYAQAIAQERVASGEVEYATAQFKRSTELSQRGISAKSAQDVAQRDLDKARQQEAAAAQGIVSARAALGGNADIATDSHPAVQAALAARDKAAYSLGLTTVRAPADGVVSQASSFKVGQYVTAGTALFALVETGDTWIEANFKETQLTHMRPGQTADVVLDTYPDRTFRATVEAVGAGTGAEFSLLPAQNATGNWVKVTQRIPVRLRLEGSDGTLPVRTGMSADVNVDTGVSRGLPRFAGLFGGKAQAADAPAAAAN